MSLFKKVFMLLAVVCTIALSSCSKDDDGAYSQYANKEVVTDSYAGNVAVTSGGQDPAGDFTGNGDSGTYSFAWDNPKSKASANFDITSPTGSVQLIINDANGTEVLNVTRSAGSNDTFAGVSGRWLVTFVLLDFNGDGSYSIHPGN